MVEREQKSHAAAGLALAVFGIIGLIVTVTMCSVDVEPIELPKKITITPVTGPSTNPTSQPAKNPGTEKSVPAWPGVPEGIKFPEKGVLNCGRPTTFVLGPDRVKMTDSELKDRTCAMFISQIYTILGKKEMILGTERIVKYAKIFSEAADDYALNATLLTSICWVESQGRTDVVSPTGPTGICQFAAGTARDMGLRVEYKKVTTTIKYRVKGKTKTKKQTKSMRIHDDRLEPKLAIPAAAKLLNKLRTHFGGGESGLQLAIAAYHMGQGRVDTLVKLALGSKYDEKKSIGENVSDNNLTYPEIYFLNKPPATASSEYLQAYGAKVKKVVPSTNLWEKIAIYMLSDQGPTYYFRIMAAKDLLTMYINDNNEKKKTTYGFDKLVKAQYRANGKEAKYRYWTWYDPDTIEMFDGLKDIKAAKKKGDLVSVEDDNTLGYDLHLSGRNAIAEKDLKNQEHYLVLRPLANDTLKEFGELLLQIRKGQTAFIPKITSLTRSLDYQEDLKETNSNARTSLPMHTTGRAFDIWKYLDVSRGEISLDKKRDLLFALNELNSVLKLSYTTTEPGCWHVTVPPE